MTMRFIIMHKANARDEAGTLPTQELIEEVGAMVGEMSKAGVLRAGDGLRPSSEGVRLNFAGGKRTVTPGPFKGGNELISAFCVVKVKTLDEAIEWASRLAAVAGDGELDIRPMTEPWHLGMVPKPKDVATTRYMIARKSDKDTEAGIHFTGAKAEAFHKVMGDMMAAGVLQMAEGLAPSSQAVRIKYSRGKAPVVIDGPFAESKELIGGFVIVEVPSRQEALKWVEPYGKALGDVEMDVRPLN
jgi:hypothetical protein